MYILNRYIPLAAKLGGAFIALLSIAADLLGTFSYGTSILIALNCIYDYWAKISYELR